MNTINFDTLKAAKSLQDAGFEAPQAEAVVGMVTHALSEGLATKEDVRDLKSSLQSSIDALDVKIDNGLNNVIQKLTILLGGIVIGSITLLSVLSRVFPVLPAP